MGASRIGSVHVQLHQVGPVVELLERQGQELVRVACLNAQPRGEGAGTGHPRSRGADLRVAPAAPPPVTQAEAERAPASVDRVDPHWCSHVAGPAHPGTREQPRVVLRGRQQHVGRIQPAVDPVGTTGHRHVAVGVHHARDDRAPARVDDREPVERAGILLAVDRPDPPHDPVIDQHADAQPQVRPAPVRERSVPEQHPGHWRRLLSVSVRSRCA
jgi:hypothetical protein